MKRLIGVGIVLSAAYVAGCGSSRECGEGTIEMMGRCVPTSSLGCGDGTHLDTASMTCEPDAVCGAGTTLNAATGMCEAIDGLSCATGTIAMGDECVPDGTMICVGSTTFDAASGTCVLDETACAEGTVLVAGECVLYDDTLVADIHAGAEPDDPLFFEGEAVPFTPPGAGETVTIDGCIVPANFDGDDEGTVDFDVDFFDFSVSAPGLYAIRADGTGGLSAAFAVLSPEPELAQWIRVGLDLTNDSAERQVWLPRAGRYYFAIFDSRSVALDSIDAGLAFARAVGDEDSCYFASIEALATPTPTALDGDTRVGMLGDPQFFTTTATAETVIQATLDAESPAVQPALVVAVGDQTAFGAGTPQAFAISPIVQSGETATIVVDTVFDYSLAPVEYSLRVQRPAQVPADGTVTITHEPAVYSFLWFEAEAGDVVRFRFDGPTDLLVDVVNPALTGFSALPENGTDAYFQAVESGRYLVRIANQAPTAPATYDVTFELESITPTALTLGTAADVVLDREYAFLTVEASGVEWLKVVVDELEGTGLTDVDVLLFERDALGSLDLPTSFGMLRPIVSGTTDGEMARILDESPGEVLIAVRDADVPDLDESFSLTVSEETHREVMLTVGTPVSFEAEPVPAGGRAFVLARAEPGSTVTLTATGPGADAVIHRLAADATSLEEIDAGGTGAREEASAAITSSGWVAFAIGAGAVPAMVDLVLTASPPPYSVGAGTRTYSDICGASGATTVLTDADDTMSSLVSLTALTTFQFFGDSATRFLVSSNGWMTFDGSYAGGSSAYGSLADGLAPDAVIAPAWGDHVTTVCVQQTAAEAIVQWVGAEYPAFAGSPAIEMQAILYADGRIELVYGPGHTSLPTESQHGIEAPDGGFALSPTPAMVAPGSSVLFTPS
jgi:hypothetical protein